MFCCVKTTETLCPNSWKFFFCIKPTKSHRTKSQKISFSSSPVENDNNTINLNSNQVHNLKKIARAGLLVIKISVLSLNVQGMLFCRPAMAAWYWPLRKVKRAVRTFRTTEEFWANEKIPMEFKGSVLEMLSRQKIHRSEALKVTRMSDGKTDSAIEIVDSLMLKEPLELEWRLVKAQIQDNACRLEEAKEGFEFYLTLEDFNPEGSSGYFTPGSQSPEE